MSGNHYSDWYAKRLAELNKFDRDNLFRCEFMPNESADDELPTMTAPKESSELTRLQDENRRLRAFVEYVVEGRPISGGGRAYNLEEILSKAAALLASMKPAEE